LFICKADLNSIGGIVGMLSIRGRGKIQDGLFVSRKGGSKPGRKVTDQEE